MRYPIGFIFFLIFSSCIMTGCKTAQISPEKYEKSKIYFGRGGGFTGELKEYCLLENGDIYQINPSSREASLRNSISKSSAKTIFKNLENMELQKYKYDQPGNMYYWMKCHADQDLSLIHI